MVLAKKYTEHCPSVDGIVHTIKVEAEILGSPNLRAARPSDRTRQITPPEPMATFACELIVKRAYDRVGLCSSILDRNEATLGKDEGNSFRAPVERAV